MRLGIQKKNGFQFKKWQKIWNIFLTRASENIRFQIPPILPTG